MAKFIAGRRADEVVLLEQIECRELTVESTNKIHIKRCKIRLLWLSVVLWNKAAFLCDASIGDYNVYPAIFLINLLKRTLLIVPTRDVTLLI